MSNFDPASFLDATVTEAMTKRPPLPAGKTYQGLITDLKSRSWVGKNDPSKSGVAVDVVIEIDLSSYPEEQKLLGGATKVVLQDGIMLDTTPTGGFDFAPGKNGKLRKYREALDMNKPGEPFSLRNMQGRMILVKIKHDPYEGDLYDKVDSVAKIS